MPARQRELAQAEAQRAGALAAAAAAAEEVAGAVAAVKAAEEAHAAALQRQASGRMLQQRREEGLRQVWRRAWGPEQGRSNGKFCETCHCTAARTPSATEPLT